MWLQSVKKCRRRWDPKACELLHNMRCEKGGGVIMLINYTTAFVTDCCTRSNKFTFVTDSASYIRTNNGCSCTNLSALVKDPLRSMFPQLYMCNCTCFGWAVPRLRQSVANPLNTETGVQVLMESVVYKVAPGYILLLYFSVFSLQYQPTNVQYSFIHSSRT